MSIQVALHHRTHYQYDRKIQLGPQLVRLRPAVHCRTPVLSYSQVVKPAEHFINWQQDPHGNFVARYVFPQSSDHLTIEVDLVADMTVINPFDFFLEESVRQFPWSYDAAEAKDLKPYLETLPLEAEGQAYLDSIPREPSPTIDFIVHLNARLQQEVHYLIRLEPGVQTPDETLRLGSGSCRDSAWLLVQMLRHLGLAARFVSGYLIQLTPDVKALDGPAGPTQDFTDLHAWAEVYIPGAGWVGLDPTSGLLAGEGHLPLACTPNPNSAAPISGTLEASESTFHHEMSIQRIVETPRVTKPYRGDQWAAIQAQGQEIDRRLVAGDVRLTMGGEPTFVSIDDMDGAEWNTLAFGTEKRRLSEILIRRLHRRFAPGGLLHFGTGKWYPGESLPRWALSCFWRKDGVPIWQDPQLIAQSDGTDRVVDAQTAATFLERLVTLLEVPATWIVPVYEDPLHYSREEQRLPINVDPQQSPLDDSEARARLTKVLSRGLSQPSGYVLPLRRAWWQSRAGREKKSRVAERQSPRWVSGPWPVRSEQIFLLPGDSPIGLRLPLDSLPEVPESAEAWWTEASLEARPPLPPPTYQHVLHGAPRPQPHQGISPQMSAQEMAEQRRRASVTDDGQRLPFALRTAICTEVREGRLHVFMPPTERLEDYLDLISAVEAVARQMQQPVVIEGYLPVQDSRLRCIKVTPDPGVIEVNVHPSDSWDELQEVTSALYEEARQTRLGTEKFDLDGKHSGTGGGNHIVLGAADPADSPFLRRPDLLRSMVGYWLNHPSLSYLFSGRFVGPTSQAPRVDEGRKDALYELELAFRQIPDPGQTCPPWLVDRILRNLLIDLTGNTHRAEFCIDKLYSPDSNSGRLGLVELRGFEMPPHPQMSLAQQLLIRALVLMFWERPWRQRLIDWGTALHDRFMLPHYVWQDFGEVLQDLRDVGLALEPEWYATHFEFRFPLMGTLQYQEIQLELRAAIEPWYVLGEEPAGGGTVRYVDSSVERLQVMVQGLVGDRYQVACNGRRVPLQPTGLPGQCVAGVRYRAWCPPQALHPTIGVHTPLVFDLLDNWTGRSVAGCTYHVSHPAGRNYQTFPVNANEAEARRAARFFQMGHSAGPMQLPPETLNPAFPATLDLRWQGSWP